MDQGRKQRSRRRTIIIVLSAIGIVILVAGLALFAFFYMLGSALEGLGSLGSACATEEPNRFANTENMAHFHFPPSATNRVVDCFGLQGWSANAQFDMLPQDLDTFMASTLIDVGALTSQIQIPTPDPLDPFRSAPTEDIQQRARAMTSYLYGLHHEYEFQQEILIDTSNPELYRVYVHVLAG